MGPTTIWLPNLLVTLLLLLHAHYADAQIAKTMRPLCSGSANGRSDIRVSGGPTMDRYEDLRKMFQNCTRVYGNVEITHLKKRNIGNRTMDFLDDIEEIKGYIFIGNTDIERISFKNLKIIWGDNVIDDKAALMVEGAKNLEIISMPKLRTIEKGQIYVHAAKKLCHLMETIKTDEILNFDRSRIGYFNNTATSEYCAQNPKVKCHASCNGACWGPRADECQIVYRSVCKNHCESNQCFLDTETNERKCCHSQCIGGCFGPTAKDCVSCAHFRQCRGNTTEDCKCVEQCTSLKKYNQKLGQVEVNPDGYYSMDNRYCEKKCPVERLVQDDVCVEHCGPGMHYDPNRRDKICRKCDGECPKSCKFEGMIDSINIKELQNCSEIEGFVNILAGTFTGYPLPGNASCPECPLENVTGLLPPELNVLKTVRFISEYLYVATDVQNLRSLAFLENLEIIEGRHLYGGRQALVISKNDNLSELGLRKLKLVDKGDVIISNNPELCYLDSFNWTDMVNREDSHTVTIARNRQPSVCKDEGLVCDSSCDPAFGCVGPTASDCRKCIHWQQEGECREKCSERGFFPNLETRTCDRCYAECDKCTGPKTTDCTTCRSFKMYTKYGADDEPTVEEMRRHKPKPDDDGATTVSPSDNTLPPSQQESSLTTFTCVPECDPEKYYVQGGECKRCHRSCYNHGCDGPSNEPGPGGCKSCRYAQVNKPEANSTIGTVERCLYNSDKLHSYAVCLNNDLIDHFVQVPTHPDVVEEFECAPCDDECSTCTSKGISRIAHGCKCKNMVAYFPTYPHKATEASKRMDEKCVASCSSARGMFYDNDTIEADVAGVCRFCSPLCERPKNEHEIGCTGPSERDCLNCSSTMAYAYKQSNVTTCVKKETCHDMGLFTYEKERWCSDIDYETRDKMHKAALYLLVALFLIVVLIIALVLWRRQKRLSKELEQEKVLNNPEMPELIPMDLNGPMINKTKLNLIPKNALSRSVKELGSGAFGVVYAGCWMPTLNKGKPTKIPVAIKVVRDPSGRAQSEMLDEATKMTMLRHENLLRIVGVCLSGDDLQLVTLLRPLGNLREFLQKHKYKLSGKELIQYSYQIASGMKYLADQRVVHRDLAARNVLVKNTQHVEITDFGLAKLIDIGDTSVQVGEGKVAIKWLALEALEKQVYNTATDVWAFGVTVWEILKFGESPYANMTPMKIKEFLLEGGRLEQPSNCSVEMYKILIDCWLPNPDSRPTFAVLKEILYKYCKAPWYFITNTDQHEAMDMDDCSQRGLIEEILDETDFEDPQNYFDSEPNTPGCVTSSDIFNPMGVRRMDSLGSQRYAQDPTTRKEFGMNDDNYLVPNSSAAEMGATMYTPVVVDETGNSSLVESLGYYNEVKPGAEYINDTQNLKKSVRNSRDDRLSMIEEDDGMLEKESCL